MVPWSFVVSFIMVSIGVNLVICLTVYFPPDGKRPFATRAEEVGAYV